MMQIWDRQILPNLVLDMSTDSGRIKNSQANLMHTAKVSLLMPFKNTSKYIGDCINSIKHQSYDEWELIAVDDHSNDESKLIVEEHAASDKRIKLIPNSGNGIIDALRTAYKLATGNYISRMDSDDLMKPLKLAHMVGQLNLSGPGHIALGQVQYFSETGISEGYRKYEEWINQLTQEGGNYTDIYKECVIPSPSWMVLKDDLDSCGAFNHDRYPEDYDLTFRFRKHQLKCLPCSEVLHLWRDYPSRTSRTSAHYAQNSFLDLKVHYFLELDWSPSRPLALWGAGEKGKTIAKILKEDNINFYWLCDNPNKIGQKIYDIELFPYQFLETLKSPQSIISVANPEAQCDIHNYFDSLKMQSFEDYYFFC